MPRLEDIPSEVVADAVSRAVVEEVAMGGDADAIAARALARVSSDLGLDGADTPRPPGPAAAGPLGATTIPAPAVSPTSWRPSPNSASNGSRTIVTEDDIRSALANGQAELRVPAGSLVTALARDAAADAGLRIVEGG